MTIYRTGILVLLGAMAGLFFLWSQHQITPATATEISQPDNSADTPALPEQPAPHNGQAEMPATQSISQLQQRYQAISDNPQYPDIESRQHALRQQNPSLRVSDEELIDLLSERNAWRPAAEIPASLPLT